MLPPDSAVWLYCWTQRAALWRLASSAWCLQLKHWTEWTFEEMSFLCYWGRASTSLRRPTRFACTRIKPHSSLLPVSYLIVMFPFYFEHFEVEPVLSGYLAMRIRLWLRLARFVIPGHSPFRRSCFSAPMQAVFFLARHLDRFVYAICLVQLID